MPQLLTNKVAVMYGAGGAIGSAVARAFASEGARVFLAGRTLAKLQAVAESVDSNAEIAVVDALDEGAVNAFVDNVVARAGRVDISFNVIGLADVQRPLMELSVGEFLQPIATAMRSQFLTSRAAARHMMERRAGVILMFGGSGPQTLPDLGGFKVALDAMEGLRRQWALELGPHGVRVVTLKTGGIPETLPPDMPDGRQIIAGIEAASPLGRAVTLAEVGHVAAFVASDQASSMTAADVNISCGAIMD